MFFYYLTKKEKEVSAERPMNKENPVRAERSGSPKRYLNLVHLKLPVHELKLSRELAVYIGRGVSIYLMCNIYISNVLYLYIQHHRYIDAKYTE